MRRATWNRWLAAVVLGGSTLGGGSAGCELEPQQLTPYPEILVVIDTDAQVPRLFDRLQIDLYLAPDSPGEAPVWVYTDATLRGSPETWPVSFAVAREALEREEEVLLRIRLHPDGKVRDNRGERFFETSTLARYVDACPTFLDADAVLEGVLRTSGDPADPGIVPPDEPLPNLAIDRLVRLRLVPGEQGRVDVVLRGSCVGVQADLARGASCVADGVREPAVVERPSPPTPAPDGPSELLGSHPAPRPCEATLRPASGAWSEEVCVPGGAFILGDPAVFGFSDFDGFPERVVHLPALRVDRFEVSVGRFRAALRAGLLDDVPLPVANDDALATTSLAPAERHCTFSTEPRGREDHPLNCVSFETARAFCRAEGGDLPTEAQWEHLAAASGRLRESRHAWGSTEPTCERAVFARVDDVTSDASACVGLGYGVQPLRDEDPASGDVTPTHGIVGMAGSLREWTRDEYRAYCSACWSTAPLEDPVCEGTGTTTRTVRGGDWARDAVGLLVGLRDEGLETSSTSPRVGFRCVRAGGGGGEP